MHRHTANLSFVIFIFVIPSFLPLAAQVRESNAGMLIESTGGMVVSASPEASAVGAAVLRAGGNAVDAAVATGFALAVTYPSAGNIGGGCYILIRLADGREAAIDARETAPAAASRDMYIDRNGSVEQEQLLYGPSAAGVPGSVDGLLHALEKYGTRSREDMLRHAIGLARDGFPVHRRLAAGFRLYRQEFIRYSSTWNMFAPSGTLPAAGETWTQLQLARTLQRISDSGRAGFYRGETARLIVAGMAAEGGYITEADLADYRCIERRPLRGRYRGFDILSMPPSSSGGVALLQMLGMLEGVERFSPPAGDARSASLMIEAMRRAFADRAEFLGDPAFSKIPLDRLLSREYLDSLFTGVDGSRATPSAALRRAVAPSKEGNNTTHYSVVDRWGNAVSVTTTINSTFGSKYAVPDAGFLLNNEMDDFSARPGVPNQFGLIGGEANSIAPGKRMLSSMTPTIVLEDGKTRLLLGSPGGSRIITTVLQVLMNVLDFGLSLDAAVARRRFHHQWYPDVVITEQNAFDRKTATALRAMGYDIRQDPDFGRVDAIYITPAGQRQGFSDPR
ncbi:MAG: gamma-glutamyltransferase, partial [Bacteroidetes bacterium]|nr:gamma-glutamyltransferase [Bacteroidota bacterium]